MYVNRGVFFFFLSPPALGVCMQTEFKMFLFKHSTTSYTCVSQLFCITLIMSRLSTPLSRMQTLPDRTFLEPYHCNKATTDSDTLSVSFHHFLHLKSWLCIRALWVWVMCGYIFWCLIFWNWNLDSDINLPTSPPCKQLISVPKFWLVRVKQVQ